MVTGYPLPWVGPLLLYFLNPFRLHVQHSDYFIYYYPYCAMGELAHYFLQVKPALKVDVRFGFGTALESYHKSPGVCWAWAVILLLLPPKIKWRIIPWLTDLICTTLDNIFRQHHFWRANLTSGVQCLYKLPPTFHLTNVILGLVNQTFLNLIRFIYKKISIFVSEIGKF